VLAGALAPNWPLRANVFVLGVANGAFSIAAIGSMMSLAGSGQSGREGTRMGLWGAAQAIGFASGGLFGAAASDVARWALSSPGHPGSQGTAYATVFFFEALMFVAAAWLAAQVKGTDRSPGPDGAQPATPNARATVPGLQAEGRS
jgi:BCD family chlorophyll transporter-like MFS transporter